MKQIVLEIGGEKRTFHFGLGFLGNLIEKEKIQFYEIDEKIKGNPFTWMPLIMYYSLAWGYTRRNEFVPFDAFDVTDWVDELGLGNSVVSDFFEAFRQSLIKDVPLTETKETKKKVTVTKK